jgi:chromosome segregation ATPase
LAGVQQAVAELPELESRLTSRLEQHEATLAGVPQLASRLQQHDGALAGVQQAVTELPQLESRLTSRLEEHEVALAGVPRLTSRLEQHEAALAGVPELEPRLTARLDEQNVAVETLQHASAEQKSMLEAVSRSVSTVEERMLSLETLLAAAGERAERAAQEIAEGAQHEAAGLHASVLDEVRTLGVTVKSHAAAIESIRASMARTDDFMERVVEALESLQTMVLDQARDRAVA